MSAAQALTVAEIRAGAGESSGDFLRRAAAIARQHPAAADLAFRVAAAALERASLDLDAAGGDPGRCAEQAAAEEALSVARAVLGEEARDA